MDLRDHWIYTHAGCMDGTLAAILFQHAGGKKENIRYQNPGHVDEDIAESSAFRDPSVPILLVDLAPTSLEFADRLAGRGNFVVIDHHASAEKFAGRPGFEISVGNQACGGELFRRWLAQNGYRTAVPRSTGTFGVWQESDLSFDAPCYRRFAAMVDDHDRWKLQLPFSRQMARFFAFTGQQVFARRFMDVERRFLLEKEDYWTDDEREMLEIIEQAQERRFKTLLKKFVVRPRQFQGREIKVGYLISDEVNSSELLNIYLQQNPAVDLACQVNFQSGKCSYRGVDRVDIPTLVVPLGGGGHFNAGGCSLPEGLADLVIERVEGQ